MVTYSIAIQNRGQISTHIWCLGGNIIGCGNTTRRHTAHPNEVKIGSFIHSFKFKSGFIHSNSFKSGVHSKSDSVKGLCLLQDTAEVQPVVHTHDSSSCFTDRAGLQAISHSVTHNSKCMDHKDKFIGPSTRYRI